jgi:hypothetical protein
MRPRLVSATAGAGLADKTTFKRFIAPLRRIKWVVYCKAPFAGPKQVLRYLSRYTHRVAISNRRLVAGFWTPAAPRLSTRAAGRRPKSWTIDTNRKAALRRPLQGRERVKDQSARIVRPLFALR